MQTAEPIPNRWRIAGAAILMQVCLGILYAWSVFRGPLTQAYGWDKTQTIMPYRASILFFTLAMIAAGFLQDKKGPRKIATVGGLLLGSSCLLASFFGGTLTGLIATYGVIGGLGMGCAYVTPIATCIKWFPDKRGLVVGLAVMGFGIGPLLFGPLLEKLIGTDASAFSQTLPRTFLVLSALFFVVVTGCAQMYRVPPPGWRPAGWNPPASQSAKRADYTPGEMLKTWQFWVVWVVYFLGSSVGLSAIGEAAPMIRELSGTSAAMTGGAALGIMSILNGGGRLAWGVISDRLGRKQALIGMAVISLVTCSLILPGVSGFWPVLGGLCLIGFCYGGYLAVMPSLTADFYGSKNVGANYGMLFTAWGAAGFIVPGFLSAIVEQARRASQLAAGYDRMFYLLAALAAGAGVLALAARGPAVEQKG
ncbi:MAG: OFA family MFS transporter [Bryobacteraceae bacterium]